MDVVSICKQCDIHYALGGAQEAQAQTAQACGVAPEEQVKQECAKEVKILQNMCVKDIGIFTHLKSKGAKMVGNKSSGVTKELLMGVETGIKSMQEMGESIYAVLMDGTSRDPNIFKASDYTMQVDKAKNLFMSLADLKAKVQRIIGK